MSRPKKRKVTYGGSTLAAQRRWVDLSTDDDITAMTSWVPDKLDNTALKPKRPGSQAAAMAAEPSDEDVELVMAFAYCSRPVAITALKVKKTTDAAVNAIFEGEDLDKQAQDLAWTEMDNAPPGTSTAPTRGNSPVGSMQPNTQEEEDHQMAMALQSSQQESGVVNADGSSKPMIGPASYSQSMALVKYVAQEVLADVEITQRVQKEGAAEPRLLKHLVDGDYTPNLLTICHAIPAAREAFLMRSYLKHDYGHDSGWWKGRPIPTPTVVHVADGTTAETLADKHEELIAEVQRLMAFLHASDRVYASTGGLTETKMIKEHDLGGGSLLEVFLKSWIAAVEPKNALLSELFTTEVGTNDKDDIDTSEMTVAEITIQSEGGGKTDLTGHLDDLFWAKDLTQEVFIERPADVLILTLKQSDPEKKQASVDVPASLHLDRYLHENVASSRILRKQLAEARQKAAKLEAIEKKLTTWSYFDRQKAETQTTKKDEKTGTKELTKNAEKAGSQPANAEVAVKDLFAHSLSHFSGENRKEADANDYAPQQDPPAFPAIAAKLERVMASIEDKLRILSANKEKTRSLLSDLSKSAPSSEGEEGPRSRYTLRGVATKPNITYVLTPKADSDVEMDGQDATKQVDVDDNTPAGMQWWRLAYESNGSTASINRTKAPDYDVLRAVELEHSSALLVYASDRAVELQTEDGIASLPEPLQQFITRDNNQFKLDLAAASRNPPPSYNYFKEDDVRSSIERETDGRRDSVSSMNVNYGNVEDNEENDAPAVDILLTPSGESSGDVEMTTKENIPSITLTRDTAMGGLSEAQDGAQHVEDARDRMIE